MIHHLGLELIQQEEGFEAEPYRDAAGIWTVGFGHIGDVDGEPVAGHAAITREKATELLMADLAEAEDAVERLVLVPLTEHQRAALVSFTFNLGSGNLARSTLLKKLNSGDYEGAAREFRQWAKAGGRWLRGLSVRRGREEQLFRTSSIAPPFLTT